MIVNQLKSNLKKLVKKDRFIKKGRDGLPIINITESNEIRLIIYVGNHFSSKVVI